MVFLICLALCSYLLPSPYDHQLFHRRYIVLTVILCFIIHAGTLEILLALKKMQHHL